MSTGSPGTAYPSPLVTADASRTHPVLMASFQGSRAYPSPPTEREYTVVTGEDTVHYQREPTANVSHTFRRRGRGTAPSTSVLATAMQQELTSGHAVHREPDLEYTSSSDEDIRTPDLSWSVAGGSRDASFKKRSPSRPAGADVRPPALGMPTMTTFPAGSFVRPSEQPARGRPFIVPADAHVDGHMPQFVSASAGRRRAMLENLRTTTIGID